MGDQRIRGQDTVWGESGWCPRCEQDVPSGPDLCIGMRPGVLEACCGHGDNEKAYVSYQDGSPTQYGQAALRALGIPEWP